MPTSTYSQALVHPPHPRPSVRPSAHPFMHTEIRTRLQSVVRMIAEEGREPRCVQAGGSSLVGPGFAHPCPKQTVTNTRIQAPRPPTHTSARPSILSRAYNHNDTHNIAHGCKGRHEPRCGRAGGSCFVGLGAAGPCPRTRSQTHANKHVHHPLTCPFARPTQTHRSTRKHMHTSPPATLPHARPSVHAHTNTRSHNVAHGCKGRPKRAGGTVGGRAAPRGSRLCPPDLRRRW